ncbi:MAG: aminotransferase class V-fold PLP-dependent enzyme [Acidimicrobiia bacterium]
MSSEWDPVVDALEDSVRPYRDSTTTYTRLPAEPRARDDILAEVRALAEHERASWHDGFASGAVYHGDDGHVAFLNEVYAVTSQANPLHVDLWPSIVKYEAEIVAMTAAMLGGGPEGVASVCGAVSSGGTESILLAMRAYRDHARAERGIERPQIVAPTSVHAAFDKAAHYFGIELVRVPVGEDFRADVAAMRDAVTDRTVVVVGSTPGFPHGVIDPIEELAALARERGVGMHVDACLGGFVLPWAQRLGYPVPPFDFSVDGVTSMSADTHKFGYAAKGTSVVLYRDDALRRYQWYRTAEWTGGLYYSPTFAGSRPGALSAECWAAMLAMGERGYLEATRAIVETGAEIKAGLATIPEVHVLGDPLWVIAFASDTLDVYRIQDVMTEKGWRLNGLQNPAAVHLCVTLRHTQPSVAARFVDDLRASVAEVAATPEAAGTMAPIYGMAGIVETRGSVEELLGRYVDLLFRT